MQPDIAICCNLLQSAAICCKLLQVVTTCCHLELQPIAICCNLKLQPIATCCNLKLQSFAICCNLKFKIISNIAVRDFFKSCLFKNRYLTHCLLICQMSKGRLDKMQYMQSFSLQPPKNLVEIKFLRNYLGIVSKILVNIYPFYQ